MPTIEQLLQESRKELLDLTNRNRLISLPVQSQWARIVQIIDEKSAPIYRMLVEERKTLSFLPAPKPARSAERAPVESDAAGEPTKPTQTAGPLAQPEEAIDPTTGLAERHTNRRLQTMLTTEKLQSRLLSLYRDARTMLEEQGVHALYLALGQLQWKEAEQSDQLRHSPLVLISVDLIRKSANDRFHIQWREEDLQENLSLRARMKQDFGIDLPELVDDDAFDIAAYFAAVERTIKGRDGWKVLPDAMTLGFFSFAKFLMYRDLDPEIWPEARKLTEQRGVAGLLGEGFESATTDAFMPEEAHLDEVISVERLDHVADADSSQTRAIEMVRQGAGVVIQGPPGTGKSQSITNIIATAVMDGKKVLFVAEKMAALEVVKRRLENLGLGAICLELHSNKANKKMVIQEIGRAWGAGAPRIRKAEATMESLGRTRGILNEHAARLHEPIPPHGRTPYQIIGFLSSLGERGEQAADIDLPQASGWSGAEYEERRKLMGELAERVRVIGRAVDHPWRGVRRTTLLPVDMPILQSLIGKAAALLGPLCSHAETLAGAMKIRPVTTGAGIEWLKTLARLALAAPPMDKGAITHEIWDAGLAGLRELVAAGQIFAGAVAGAAGAGPGVIDAAWEMDHGAARGALATHGRSWFRFFNGEYRRAIVQLRAALSGPLPGGFDERMKLADMLLAGQRALRRIKQDDAQGRAAFGLLWRGPSSDWIQLAAIAAWAEELAGQGLNARFRKLVTEIPQIEEVRKSLAATEAALPRFAAAMMELAGYLELDAAAAFGALAAWERTSQGSGGADTDSSSVKITELGAVPQEGGGTSDSVWNHAALAELADRLGKWQADGEGIFRWAHYFGRAELARGKGIGPLVERLETGAIGADALVDAFDRAAHARLLRDLQRRMPDLLRFDGQIHNGHIAEFRELDLGRLELARKRLMAAHHAALPAANATGPAAIIRAELEKKQRHRPVRRLLAEAGSVVQAIKPVFMMSPLSVAQFLAPGGLEFDLLVMDEASQIRPVDALGAIARSKQLVVVGDSKQLPPTRFFDRMTGDWQEEETQEERPDVAMGDVESILGLCCAKGLPQTMLRWHYRSRHPSLIAVSNKQFYENRLFIVPSPDFEHHELGLKLRMTPESVYDRGGSRTNRGEARAICAAILEHARRSPELTLGVAAFSQAQQLAIMDELELMRRENSDIEEFMGSHEAEPFFIKNLENLQGDERDVILISVGYGKDQEGRFDMNFGPLNKEGGQRRLNVLISRAKRRCEIFTSITDEDIDLSRSSSAGVAALKAFLAYARTGRMEIARPSERAEDSPFEASVKNALESLGHVVHQQVGIAGFFIDLAVVDPRNPGRYLLGIECDGAAYHSSRSARDRDRLRQAILENHGWCIHRLWSLDWYHRPQEQILKIQKAIKDAGGG